LFFKKCKDGENMYLKQKYETLPSTNLYLKENYSQLDEYTVIICDNQTNGRGRMGRIWEMEAKENIALSILIKPDIEISEVPKLSLLVSAAVFDVISKYVKDTKIKWPNDILISNKKVCGILLESVIGRKLDALIIGIGINLNGKTFSPELINKATSLTKETNCQYNKDVIIDEILVSFDKYYQDFLKMNHSYLQICRDHSAVIGKQVMINNQSVKVLDILNNGNILVTDGKMTKDYSYGEITLNNNY
jgi:BirA family biotin operon repressor/biotin-[acetyl-CoA-carboxylase] ligase